MHRRRSRSSGTGGAVACADQYEQAVRPFVARFIEIGPFLSSAAASPTDDVLALSRGPRRGGTPAPGDGRSQASRPLHNIVLSAVTTASRAFARDFTGDRVAQVQRALALLDAARSEIR